MAQNRFNVARVVARNRAGIRAGIRDQPLPQRAPFQTVNGNRIAALEFALDRAQTGRQQRFALAKGATAPASIRSTPRGFIAPIQRLRAKRGSSWGANHVARAPSPMARRRGHFVPPR
jgi:hypothetical protein